MTAPGSSPWSVYYLSSSVVPSRSANSGQVMKMCGALARHDKVTLFARDSGRQTGDVFAFYNLKTPFGLVRSPWTGMRGIGGIVYAWRVKRKLDRMARPDLFYGRDRYSLYMIRNSGVPFIYESHFPPQNGLHAFLDQRILSSDGLVRLVTTAASIKEAYMRRYPWLESSRITVVHNAADPIPGKPGTVYGAGDGRRLRVGYVGHLHRGKGVDRIIRLADKFPNLDFHIAGGEEKDLRYWRRIAKGENVVFHGYVEKADLPALFRTFDILLAPNQKMLHRPTGIDLYPSPLKLIEYMSAGIPILASDLVSSREVLTHGEDALLCDPGSLSDWESSLRRLAGDAHLRERLGRNALERFRRGFTWDQRADAIRSIAAAAIRSMNSPPANPARPSEE